MGNILILGGLGFIGSNIVSGLLKKRTNHNITVFDLPGANNPFGSEIKVEHGDFNDEKDIRSLFKNNKTDIIIHLISTTVPAFSNDNIQFDVESNLIPTIRLLRLMTEYKIPKIVFLSSGGTVYGTSYSEIVKECNLTNPISSHGIIKMTIEKYIHLYHQIHDLNYLILRVSNPYGPYHHSGKQGVINIFIRNLIANNKLTVRGDGSAIRDYIYSGDLASIIVELIDKDINNEILNVGSGTGVSINQILTILKTINKNISIEYIPPFDSDIPKIILDTQKLRSLIKYKTYPIEEGIYKTYNNIVNHKT